MPVGEQEVTLMISKEEVKRAKRYVLLLIIIVCLSRNLSLFLINDCASIFLF